MDVVDNGRHSKPCLVNAGVPQGSIVGPTLSRLYTNHLTEKIISKFVLYADDATLFDSYTDRNDPNSRFNLCSRLDTDLLDLH